VYLSMGATSENVAERYGVTREQQDRIGYRVRHTINFFAADQVPTRHTRHTRHTYQSQQLAGAAQAEGRWDGEIVPVATTVNDKNGQPRAVVLGAPY
jgi:acetyl-CoA acetyltransferase